MTHNYSIPPLIVFCNAEKRKDATRTSCLTPQHLGMKTPQRHVCNCARHTTFKDASPKQCTNRMACHHHPQLQQPCEWLLQCLSCPGQLLGQRPQPLLRSCAHHCASHHMSDNTIHWGRQHSLTLDHCTNG